MHNLIILCNVFYSYHLRYIQQHIKKTILIVLLIALSSATFLSVRISLTEYMISNYLSLFSLIGILISVIPISYFITTQIVLENHTISILKSMGASYIFTGFLIEAAIFGIIGWCMSLVLMKICFPLLYNILQSINLYPIEINLYTTDLTPKKLSISFALIFCLSIGISIKSAIQVFRIPPKDIIFIRYIRPWVEFYIKNRLKIGIVCLGISFILLRINHKVPLLNYSIAIVFLFISFLLFLPWVFSKISLLLSLLLRQFSTITTYLAVRNIWYDCTRSFYFLGSFIALIGIFTCSFIKLYSFQQYIHIIFYLPISIFGIIMVIVLCFGITEWYKIYCKDDQLLEIICIIGADVDHIKYFVFIQLCLLFCVVNFLGWTLGCFFSYVISLLI
ncbi:MAG: hypothetical protein HQK77_05055 [Desulfobacterales bacterium]|nr:hypothetical protein [Desulfobacterales bacterium]